METSKGSMPEMHNKREGDMGVDELDQCILDMETWLSSNALTAESKAFCSAPGATDAQIAALPSSTPSTLKQLLQKHDGLLPLMDFIGLTCSEIAETCAANKSSAKWGADFCPFGKNPDGDILVVCSSGVHRWDAELGLGSCEAKSISEYLEKYRNLMVQGKLEFDDALGLIEVL